MLNKTIIFPIIILCCTNYIYSQTFDHLQIKEKYDKFNFELLEYDSPCTRDPADDSRSFGDAWSKILEGYITMYKTTEDKAYLYKFIKTALCIMRNRHDYIPNGTGDKRWGHDYYAPEDEYQDIPYHDGYIIAALARFVYFIKIEEPALQTELVYQFQDFLPNNNGFNETFVTFLDFANWLQNRVGETIWWFIGEGYFHGSFDNYGIAYKNDINAEIINKQVGFARAIMFIGETANDQNLKILADIYDLRCRSNVVFEDRCEGVDYNEPVFRVNSTDNAYWWSGYGWAIPINDCWQNLWFRDDEPNYEVFSRVEDISHGTIVTWLPIDYYLYNPNTGFTSQDMIRFSNMFTKKIYDGNGQFYTGVNGTDGPVCLPDECIYCPHNYQPWSFMEYMHLSKFDDIINTSPNVYDIIMPLYENQIHVFQNRYPDYRGGSSKGHADVVQAQWERENYSLTLYNRKIVYDQNFVAKKDLTIYPTGEPGYIFAEPNNLYGTDAFNTENFIVSSGVKVELKAGNKIILKPGFKAEAGSEFRAYIDPSLLNNTKSSIVESNFNIPENNYLAEEEPKKLKEKEIDIEISPNPNNGNFTVKTNFTDEANGIVIITNLVGIEILKNKITSNNTLIDISSYPKGIYIVKISINCKNYVEKIIYK